jgi:hypothetical protein
VSQAQKNRARNRKNFTAMAINDDTINFNSTVDYFKLYNDGNSTLSSTTARENSSLVSTATAIPTSSLYPSTSTPSSLSTSTSPSNTVPLVTAATLTITSTIINNYTSQNYSNYNTNHSHNSTINSFNQSTLYQFKNLSNASSDDNNNSSFSSVNDSAKISYESGSNFMLLLEDFGEYFYNYNGSDFNSSISIYQANCSLTNSTCGDVTTRKLRFVICFWCCYLLA